MKEQRREADRKRLIEEEKRRALQAEREAAAAELQQKQSEDRQKELEAITKAYEEEVAAAKQQALADAEELADMSPDVRDLLKLKVPQIKEQFLMGKYIDGPGKFISEEEALRIARGRFIDKHVNIAANSVRDQFRELMRERAELEGQRKAKEAAEAQRLKEDFEKQERSLHAERLKHFDQARKELRANLHIADFNAVLAPSTRCEHGMDITYWAGKYGNGIKCKKCGVELTTSHQDITQYYATSAEMEEAIQRQR